MVWSVILAEESGEVAQAAFNHHISTVAMPLDDYRKELVQAAAVCVAAIECLDRHRGK